MSTTLMHGTPVRETIGNAPVAPLQGSGLPFAGVDLSQGNAFGYGTSVSLAPQSTRIRPLVDRKDDAQFPPRGRPV